MRSCSISWVSARSLFALLAVAAAHVSAAPIDDLVAFVSAERERLSIPGVSVAVIDGADVGYISLGVRRAGADGEVTPSDAFNIGSVSKTVASWAVMRLAETGRVSLDTPVRQYLGPRWQLPASEFDDDAVTLRSILLHTSGLSVPSYQGLPPGTAAMRLEDSLNGSPVRSSAVRLIGAPGAGYRYSGGGFTVAQLVVENVTGLTYAEFVGNEIFAPLDMAHAVYVGLDDAPLPVHPHDYAGRPITDYRIVEQAAGGLRASAEDMVGFIRANMGPNPVLAESTVDALHDPVVPSGDGTDRTLGFSRRGNVLSHGGHSRGWVAQIDFDPSRQRGLVMLTNSANGLHFVEPVRCKWAELYAIDDLESYCRQVRFEQRATDWGLAFFTGAMWLAALWIAARRVRDVRFRGAAFRASAKAWRRAVLAVLVIVGLWTVLGTGLGVYLSTGVDWGLPAIGYFSPHAQSALLAASVWLGVIAGAGFVGPKVPGATGQ